MQNKNKGYITLILLSFIILLVLPIFIVIYFIYPSYDDYWLALIVQKKGFLQAQTWWYNNFSGRYISTFIGSLNCFFCTNIVWYKATQLLLLLLSLFSSFVALRTAIKIISKGQSNTLNILAFLLFVTFFFNNLPGFSEYFFWMMGTVTYSLGISMVCILFYILFNNEGSSKKLLIVALLSLLAMGTSELAAFTILILLAIKLLFNIIENGILKAIATKYSMLLLVVTIFFITFVLKSPGSHQRLLSAQAEYKNAGNLLFAFKNGVISGIKLVYNILYVRAGIALIIITSLLTVFIQPKEKRGEKRKKQLLIWSVIQVILIIYTFATCIIYVYGAGITTVIPRALSFIFILWSFDIIVSGIFLSKYGFIKTNKLANIFLLVFVLFFVIRNKNGNIINTYKDIYNGSIISYNTYQQQQYQNFKNCNDSLILKSKPSVKPINYVWDLSDLNYKSRYYNYYKGILCGNIDWDNLQLK